MASPLQATPQHRATTLSHPTPRHISRSLPAQPSPPIIPSLPAHSHPPTLPPHAEKRRRVLRRLPRPQIGSTQHHTILPVVPPVHLPVQVSDASSCIIASSFPRLWKRYKRTSYLLIQIPVGDPREHFGAGLDARSSRYASSLRSGWTNPLGRDDGVCCSCRRTKRWPGLIASAPLFNQLP